MPTKTVKLGVLTSGVDQAISDLTKLGESKDKLSGDASIKAVLTGADVTEAKITTLRADIDAATKRAATFTVDASDKLANAKLLDINTKLTRLGARVIQPGIDPNIVQSGFLKADAALDELAKNRTVHINVDVNQSVLSKTKGLIGSFGGNGGGSSGDGEAGGAGGGGLLEALATPGGAVAALGVGLTALPFIAQAAAGGITAALGGALAGLGVVGALQSAKVQASFTFLKNSAVDDLGDIGSSFVPVMQNIFNTASSTLNKLTPVFSNAAQTISKPFQLFSDTLIKTFGSPQVEQSISGVAGAFGKLLTTVTPQLAGDMNQIAGGISAISNAVANNPQGPADFVHGLVDIVSGTLNVLGALTRVANWVEANWDWFKWVVVPEVAAIHEAITHWTEFQHEVAVIFDGVRAEAVQIWGDIYGATIGVAIRIGHDVETQFNSLWHSTVNIWHGLGSDTKTSWNDTYGATIGVAIRIVHDVETQYDSLLHSTVTILDGLRSASANAWNAIWADTIGKIISGIATAVAWFRGLPAKILGALGALRTLLVDSGEQLINGLFSGAEAILSDVGNWVKDHIFNPIVGAIKSLFGINSPSTVMAGLGGHLVSGLILGLLKSNPTAMITKIFGSLPSALGSLVEKGVVNIAKLPGKALSALAGLGGKLLSFLGIGGKGGAANVVGWLTSALAVAGKSISWLEPLEMLVSKESGGSATAVDPISVDGEHATGLLQMLPSTFAAYELPGFSDILNPLDNAIASIRYISAEYGSPSNIPGLEGGSYVGYDQGGWLMPGYHMVANLTGKPEQVIPAGGVGAGGGVTVNIYAHPSNNPDEIYEQVWQGLRNLRRHKGNQPLGLG